MIRKKILGIFRLDLGLVLILGALCLAAWDLQYRKSSPHDFPKCQNLEYLGDSLSSTNQKDQALLGEINHFFQKQKSIALEDTASYNQWKYDFSVYIKDLRALASQCFLSNQNFQENFLLSTLLDSIHNEKKWEIQEVTWKYEESANRLKNEYLP